MPTYVYECQSCQKVMEVEQRITEPPLEKCECKGKLVRLIQPTAVMFKGSGFYVNDTSSPSPTVEAPACSGEPASCPACAPETSAPNSSNE